MSMDKRAIRILFQTFWSPSGWKSEKERTVAPDDFAYAKSAGAMFDPLRMSHTEIVQRAITAATALTPRVVADGFLASLSTKRLDLRSALGSYAVLRHFPDHHPSSEQRQCTICGAYEQSDKAKDLNVLSFERFKWGGVRHDQPLYALFDLEQFMKGDRPCPSTRDVQIFAELIEIILAVPLETSAAILSKHLSNCNFKSSKAEREIVIGILGLCGILETTAHPGYSRQFVAYSRRELPSRRFVDMHYPACWWKRIDGINQDALRLYFGHIL
jgi:hypothetical protein